MSVLGFTNAPGAASSAFFRINCRVATFSRLFLMPGSFCLFTSSISSVREVTRSESRSLASEYDFASLSIFSSTVAIRENHLGFSGHCSAPEHITDCAARVAVFFISQRALFFISNKAEGRFRYAGLRSEFAEGDIHALHDLLEAAAIKIKDIKDRYLFFPELHSLAHQIDDDLLEIKEVARPVQPRDGLYGVILEALAHGVFDILADLGIGHALHVYGIGAQPDLVDVLFAHRVILADHHHREERALPHPVHLPEGLERPQRLSVHAVSFLKDEDDGLFAGGLTDDPADLPGAYLFGPLA